MSHESVRPANDPRQKEQQIQMPRGRDDVYIHPGSTADKAASGLPWVSNGSEGGKIRRADAQDSGDLSRDLGFILGWGTLWSKRAILHHLSLREGLLGQGSQENGAPILTSFLTGVAGGPGVEAHP